MVTFNLDLTNHTNILFFLAHQIALINKFKLYCKNLKKKTLNMNISQRRLICDIFEIKMAALNIFEL